MRLLERAEELQVLDAALGLASNGRGSVVLVAGEAGIGKTSLVESFTASADGVARVLSAACDDLLTPRPLGAFRDIAIELGGAVADLAVEGGQSKRIVTEIHSLMTAAASPVVLIVEDAHWADDATLDALRYLGRRTPALPVVLVVTYRTEDTYVGHPLLGVLGSLTGPRTRRIELGPLSIDAVSKLATGHGLHAASLYATTGGNPFYVTQVLAAEGAQVPATVRDAVLARVDRLGPDTRSVFRCLSVVPSRVEWWLVDALIEDSDIALAEAERAGVQGVGPTHVWFRHELARRAVESSMPTAESARHNRLVLSALADRAVESSRIVHHASAAHDIAALLEHGPGAIQEAMRVGSLRQAVAHLTHMLRHEDRIALRERAAMCSDRAYCLYLLNRFRESVADAEKAVKMSETDADPIQLGGALIRLTRAAYWAYGPLAAQRAAHRAAEVLEATGDTEQLARAYGNLARAHSNLATVGGVAEPAPTSVEYAERALELAELLDRDDLRSHALNYQGSGRLSVGDESGGADLDRAIDLAVDDARVEYAVRACVNAAGSAHRAGRLDDAERYVEQGLRLGADGEFHAGTYRLELTRQSVLAARGDWDAAEDGLRGLITMPGEPGIMGPLARQLLARILARRGSDQATDLLSEVAESAAASDDIYVVGPVTAALVEAAWLRGEAQLMLDLAAPALRMAENQGHRLTQCELIRYLQRAGHDVAPETDIGVGPWLPGLAGRWREAAKAWAAVGERYEAALELASSGQQHAMLESLATLDELDAVAAAAIVRRRLREAGAQSVPRGPQRRTRDNPAGLTDRQLEVLQLLTAGLARRLYPLAQQKGLEIKTNFAVLAAVRADAGRLRQILTNLVSNAIKYSDRGPITFRSAKTSDGRCYFAVEDEGVGISADDIERVFLPFEQVESSLHRRDSTGLGLTISRTLARVMDGEITATSAGAGMGSEFRLYVPQADGGEGDSRTAVLVASGSREVGTRPAPTSK